MRKTDERPDDDDAADARPSVAIARIAPQPGEMLLA
jgi:hypothetical protein